MLLNDLAKKLGSNLEARMILRHLTGYDDSDLIANDGITLTPGQSAQLDHMIDQRLNGRPISKIIGYKEFYGRDFVVNDNVLDPRPETEMVVDIVKDHSQSSGKELRILDLGTGSGCLVVTLLAEMTCAKAVAVDISQSALDVAKENAQRTGVQNRCTYIKSNWFDSVEGQFDVIVSNPPYIESFDIENLSPEVKKYDPISALDGGDDGLNPYKVILPQIRSYLKKGGIAVFEHGTGQRERIKRLIENEGFLQIRSYDDLAGHQRILSFIHR